MRHTRRSHPTEAVPEPAGPSNTGVAEAPVSGELAELANTDLAHFFGPEGPLAAALEGYELRPSQLEMAQAVKRALLEPSVALVEAPTGTGKSIAYLLPAILSGKTVVVATANKALQSQLFTKDIPFLRALLNKPISAVVVKGRSNFVCTHKWEREQAEQRTFALYDREDDQVRQVRRWLDETDTGDVDDLPFVLNSDLRPRIVSYPDDCLHSDCRFYEDQCWVNFMRDQAAEAQILVTNHHLLLNALELGFAGERILPPASVYIVDEAHGLEQTATSVYETSVTDYTVEQLLGRSVYREHLDEDELDGLRFQNTLAFQEIANLNRDNAYRIEDELESLKKLGRALRDLAQRMKQTHPYGGAEGDAAPDLVEGGSRTRRGGEPDEAAEARRIYDLGIEALSSAANKLLTVASPSRDGTMVRYAVRVFDRRHISLEVHAAPINPAGLLSQYLFHPEGDNGPLPRTVICTSATLATNGHFEHFKARCGITATGEEWVLPAVFDYPHQALLYQPPLRAFDFRASESYYDAAAQEIERLLEVSRGRTLCLFTSWSGLQQVAGRLQNPAGGIIWPVRAQGDAPRNALVEWFLATPNSVLLATRSFWEGLDIPGDDLSLVIMDKMPFPTPNDPLHSARMAALKEEGRSDFDEYMVPLMTLALKQGFGRLIRRATDLGVVAILDERLSSKAYGRQARKDLPPARFSREFKDVHKFFQQALRSPAEFALNVWAAPLRGMMGLDGSSGEEMRWRWQLLRLQDGRADQGEGLLPGASAAQAELQAMVAGLADLQRRIEQAGRKPQQFGVEVRCSPEAVELAAHSAQREWSAARALWQVVHLVPIAR